MTLYFHTTYTYKHVNTKILSYSDYLFCHRWTHFPLGCCNIKLAVLWIHFRAINLVIKPLCIRVTTISFKKFVSPYIFTHIHKYIPKRYWTQLACCVNCYCQANLPSLVCPSKEKASCNNIVMVKVFLLYFKKNN